MRMYNLDPESCFARPVISDLKESYRNASKQLWAMKSDPEVKKENERILKMHVRRRRSRR